MFFLQDGSYSRGPVDIPVGEVDESEYFLSPTYKFEQVGSDFTEILMYILSLRFSDVK